MGTYLGKRQNKENSRTVRENQNIRKNEEQRGDHTDPKNENLGPSETSNHVSLEETEPNRLGGHNFKSEETSVVTASLSPAENEEQSENAERSEAQSTRLISHGQTQEAQTGNASSTSTALGRSDTLPVISHGSLSSSSNELVGEKESKDNSNEESSHGNQNEQGRNGHCSEQSQSGSNVVEYEKARDTVTKAWQEIDKIRPKWLDINKNRPKRSCTGWRVVRIFVSSTFSDFHAERELLVKKVIPHMNLWCKTRKIHLLECDLRWGIPKDTTTEDTIDICLEEIEKCLIETEGQAFFLNLLGERYGWIPNYELLSKEIVEKFDLVRNISITQMEIVHGAIGSNSKNAAFFIRDSSLIPQIPEEYKALFVDNTELGKQSLCELKRQLRKRFPHQVFDYKCSFKDVDNSSGVEKVALDNLEDFEMNCMQFFKNAIEIYYPDISEDLDPNQVILLHQDVFVEMKSSTLIGRETEKEFILQFLSSQDAEMNYSQNYLVVIGDPGIGKSALLSSVVMELKSKQVACLYSFASATPGSTVSSFTMELFAKQLYAYFGLSSDGYDELLFEEKVKKFMELVQRLMDEEKEIVFVFDAINQFSDENVMSLRWLPSGLKGKVKCVISCTGDSPLVGLIEEKVSATCCSKIVLKGFEAEDSKKCVEALLGRYNKRLDETQMGILLSNKESPNPLWLSLVCEELRIFGVFEKLTEKIEQLPDSLMGLIEIVLDRVITEDETKMVKDAICLLVCSESGLTPTELRWSLGDGTEKLALMSWARCRVLMQPYLISTGRTRDEEHLNFFHDSIKLLVKQKYLDKPEDKRAYHKKIADTLSSHCDDEARVADELPIQLLCSGEYSKLVEFFRKDRRSLRVNQMKRSHYLSKLRCKTPTSPTDKNFSFPVYICNICSTRMNAFSPTPGLNKDMCGICGTRVPFKQDNRLALLCMRHKQRTAPGNANCYACSRVIFTSQKSMPFSQLYLCLSCSALGQKCVHLEY